MGVVAPRRALRQTHDIADLLRWNVVQTHDIADLLRWSVVKGP